MRRRVMMVDSGGKNRASIVAGDILCAKSDGSRYVFDADDYADIASTDWTPIGVVVIPPSHDVYGTGEGAAVSLKYANPNSPDGGPATAFRNGQYNVDTTRTNFNRINTTDNTSNPTISHAYGGAILPSDKFSDIECITDPNTYYINDSSIPCAPSPYLSDGSRNEDYYTTEYTEFNVLSDFDGIGNTDILCSLATAQSDWRTASTITDKYSKGYSPAACCCWRYHTVGTNQGDWYFPAMGELGYLMVRFNTINNSISNVGGITVLTNQFFWSSSEFSDDDAHTVYTQSGYVGSNGKNTSGYVKGFIHF